MSKTIRKQKTKGWIQRLQHMRRERKLARDLKADQSLFETETFFEEVVAAM